MQELLDTVRAFWADWGPWISLSLIPTLVTGLAVSPRTRDASGMVQRIWDGLKQVLSLLSIATFRDQPGTFQMPLKMGKLVKKEAGPALILILSVSMSYSCAGMGSKGEDIKNAAIDCSSAAIQENVEGLWPVVTTILAGEADSWRQMLTGLAKEVGRDALACALQRTQVAFLAATQMADEPTAESRAAAQGVNKARVFIREQNWTYIAEE